MPLTLPPGLLKLATNPLATASPLAAMTIGTVFVAFLAARVDGVLSVTIASTRD